MSSLGARVHPSSRSHAPHPVSHRSRVHHRRPSTPRNPASSTPSLASRALAFASARPSSSSSSSVGRSCRRLNLSTVHAVRARPDVRASTRRARRSLSNPRRFVAALARRPARASAGGASSRARGVVLVRVGLTEPPHTRVFSVTRDADARGARERDASDARRERCAVTSRERSRGRRDAR